MTPDETYRNVFRLKARRRAIRLTALLDQADAALNDPDASDDDRFAAAERGCILCEQRDIAMEAAGWPSGVIFPEEDE